MPPIPWTLGPIAHRGLHNAKAGIIENTGSAIAAALAKGYAIEIDLQAARDGMPVVFHDERLERLVDGAGEVRAFSPGELARLPMRHTGDRIMAFGDLLDLVGGRVPLYLEVKTAFGPPGALEQRIAERCRSYAGPLAVMSFDHALVVRLKDLLPQVPRGFISYRWDDDWMPQLPPAERRAFRKLSLAEAADASFIAWNIDDLPDAPPLRLREERGMPLLTWTVRTAEQRARAAQYADAMIFEGFEP